MPPTMPTVIEKIVSSGSPSVVASTRGSTSFCTGSAPIARIASTCSVTCIAPSSEAMPAPARPPTISAASTGPSSRTIARPTMLPT